MAAARRIYRRRPSRLWFLAALFVALVAVRCARDRWFPEADPHFVPPPSDKCRYVVERVIDGDTLLVRAADGEPHDPAAPRQFRLRLLGIDCPETVHPDRPVEPWGPEATAFTSDFVQGRTLRLVYDRRRTDSYDRYLAYVFVDERLLNEELVRSGLAVVKTFPGDSESVARRLRAAEKEARENARGVWSERQ